MNFHTSWQQEGQHVRNTSFQLVFELRAHRESIPTSSPFTAFNSMLHCYCHYDTRFSKRERVDHKKRATNMNDP